MNPIRRLPVIGRYFRKPSATAARSYSGMGSMRRRAPGLYYAFRTLFRSAIRTQHREIQAIGLENIPPDGPVMLVGNHPNSYLDYLNLLQVVRHPIAVAAKDTITNMPYLGPLLRRGMLMTPISRKIDQEDNDISESDRREANERSLRECVEALVNGRLFNIFGEGASTDSRKLNKIKLGFMHIAIQAEKEFNFQLNLRIVPYGLYYDRINKFQSSVVVVFGRPFKLQELIKIPPDFLSLDEEKRRDIEKKLMVEGKARLQRDIEEMIISIPDKGLVDLIDDSVALYSSSPVKYMNAFGNIREKYRMSKNLADAILRASHHGPGRERLVELRRLLMDYQRKLRETHMRDDVVRREHTWAEFGFYVKAMFKGMLLYPLILIGFLANYPPRLMARFRRYQVIQVQKRPRVDGDEQAVLFGFAGTLITYPLAAAAIFQALQAIGSAAAGQWLNLWLHSSALASWLNDRWQLLTWVAAILTPWALVRLWRFSLWHGQHLRAALVWSLDWILEVFRGQRVRELRRQRYEIIDRLDFLLGDYHS
ncbi:MAG: 1-acyl-sn-glycerol-3-phosphate acyltransferase [Leptospirales bacterium]|nr:1-acyl-sn-glycerol-3-phosphate acyltransferase [Leptospirales bacterium]